MAQPPAPLAYSDLERLAASIAKSGLFGIKTPDQAMVLMMIAQAEGRHPALAARDFDIIQGRPSKKAEAMARDFLDAGGKIVWNALDDTIADATFSHPQGGTARIVWDMARATRAGLGGKDMWQKYPRQMLRSRTVSEGVRTVWPMATSGFYEPGEVADMPAAAPQDAHSGPTIDADGQPYDANPAAYRTPPARAEGFAPLNPDGGVALNDAPASPPAPPQQSPAAAMPTSGRKARTIEEWLDGFELAARDLQSAEQADRLITSKQALWMKDNASGSAKARFDAMVFAVMAKWLAEPDDKAPPDDVPTDPPT
jgi:hypothetical protein